jgi:hypothetical protein
LRSRLRWSNFYFGKARGWSGELGLRVYLGELSWPVLACFRLQGLYRIDAAIPRCSKELNISHDTGSETLKQDSREKTFGIVYSPRIESWYSVRLQCGKNAKTRVSARGRGPRLIDLAGPVTVFKRAKHDFSWTQSIG